MHCLLGFIFYSNKRSYDSATGEQHEPDLKLVETSDKILSCVHTPTSRPARGKLQNGLNTLGKSLI